MKRTDLQVAGYIDHAHRHRAYPPLHAGHERFSFSGHEWVQDAVIRIPETVDEAARNIERDHPAFATAHADVPKDEMYLMRNRIAHGYFSVDPGIEWQTLQRELPGLQQLPLRLRQA